MKCKATRSDGEGCQAQAMAESRFCYWHDPKTRQEMLEAARRGGARHVVELPEAETLTPALEYGKRQHVTAAITIPQRAEIILIEPVVFQNHPI